MSVTERLAGAADRLTELEVPVPDAGRVLRRSRRRRGSVYGVAVAGLVLGGIGVVATSRTDQATVATGATQSAPSPDAPIGLTRSAAFWPDAQHRPNSPVALGRALAALLGWGDSAEVELVCLGKRDFTDNIGGAARRAWGVPADCQLGVGNDGKMIQLRISSPAIGAEVRALVFPTAEATNSGWAFIEVGPQSFGSTGPAGASREAAVRADGPESATLDYPAGANPSGTQEVRWWAATHDRELFGAVPAGSPIRIPAPAESIVNVILVFVDGRGNALGARGGSVTRVSSVTCCNLAPGGGDFDHPVQFPYRRAVLAPPRADDTVGFGPDGVTLTVERFSPSAPIELSLGRYTDLDYAALEPGGSTPVLSDRLVWVLIEPLGSAAIAEVVHIVDAHTGEELLTFDGPAGSTCAIEPGAAPDRCGNP